MNEVGPDEKLLGSRSGTRTSSQIFPVQPYHLINKYINLGKKELPIRVPGKEKIFKDLAEMQLGEIVVGKAPAT